jgi:hypothetical protein
MMPHSTPHSPSLEQESAEAADQFDLTKLRLDQSFTEAVGVKKLLTTVPVRKPNRQDFIRVHSDEGYRMDAALIEFQEERETYLVVPDIARELPGEYFLATIYTAINRQGVPFLWPVRLPTPDGRVNEWHHSARQGVTLAMRRWIRLKANMSLGAYELYEAEAVIPDPDWPDLPFEELVRIGFKDRLINRVDHPAIKRLRGLV